MAHPAVVALTEDAHDIASEFLFFEDYLPAEAAADLSALATVLFGLKTALLDLHTHCRDPRNARATELIDEEEYVVTKSIEYTFQDIRRLFGGLARPSYRNERDAHRAVWKNINDFFQDEGSSELGIRLEHYQELVQLLTEIVQRYGSAGNIARSRLTLTDTVGLRGPRISTRVSSVYWTCRRMVDCSIRSSNTPRVVRRPSPCLLPLTGLAPRSVRSWERPRPHGPDPNGRPHSRGRQPGGARPPGNHPPFRRRPSPGLPEANPPSPGASASSLPSPGALSNVLGASATPRHWLVDVWSQQRSNTPFTTTGAECVMPVDVSEDAC